MGCAHEHVLLGDIGATNARFALLVGWYSWARSNIFL